jgi:hypothetical protein
MLSSADFVANPGFGTDTGGINQLTVTAVDPFIGFEAIQLTFNGEAGSVINFAVVDQSGTTFNFTNQILLGGRRPGPVHVRHRRDPVHHQLQLHIKCRRDGVPGRRA